jgi:predicted DNA-binding antitoxin AbrB/MazE fold protein
MKTIQAIYENGVFRPTTPIDLPEGSEVTVELRTTVPEQPQPTDSQFAHLEPGLAKTYAILSERYDSGQADIAARHNEHQP